MLRVEAGMERRVQMTARRRRSVGPQAWTRLGWTARRTAPAIVAGALLVGVFWWFAAEKAFQGNARSLLLVDAAALLLAFPLAWSAAPHWRGRAAAWFALVALALVGLWVAWVVWNLLHPSYH
jgi:hypothetical protein